jgi:CheY-like chemotaxis protein
MPRQGRCSKTVLVIEDDPSIGGLIAAALEGEGFRPVVARDGNQALRRLSEVEPDAITLDLELPGLDGRSVLRRLRSDRKHRHVPVVVVSACSDSLSRQERDDVCGTLAKPFDVPELIQAVNSAVASV